MREEKEKRWKKKKRDKSKNENKKNNRLICGKRKENNIDFFIYVILLLKIKILTKSIGKLVVFLSIYSWLRAVQGVNNSVTTVYRYNFTFTFAFWNRKFRYCYKVS